MKDLEHTKLIDTFSDFNENKNIEPATMQSVLEDVFRSILEKKYNSAENFDIIVNVEKGDFEIYHLREVVRDEDLEDENSQISLTDARKIDEDYEIGEEVSEQVNLLDFGRRNILALRQNLTSKIMEIEKYGLFSDYKDRVGQIIHGEVYQVWNREMLVLDDEQNELILPRSETIHSDRFRKGDTMRAAVIKVEMRNNSPLIVLSRTAPVFLERLFELEVPEIQDGLITIRKIVREPGERAKVAVESFDDRIDPVGACVGMNGARIRGIVRELNNENIDVVNYSENMELYISRALNPARINSMEFLDEGKVKVYLDQDQVSKAIGKSGLNIKLAGRLAGYDIEVYREIDEEDVSVDEFADEIDQWIIDQLKEVGCDTARSVLKLSAKELERRTDFEEETIEQIYRIFRAEFEEGETEG